MDKFLSLIGFTKNIDYKVKVTYILSFVACLTSSFFLILHSIFAPYRLILFVQSAYVIICISVIIILKYKYYNTAKYVLVFSFFVQIILSVFVWFRFESGMYMYLLLVPMGVFLVFRYEVIGERIFTTLVSSVAVLLFLLSSLSDRSFYLYDLPAEVLELYKNLSIMFTLVPIIFVYYMYSKELSGLHRELNVLANTDGLTRILNRRSLIIKGHEEFKLARKYKHSFTIILFDIDHFKKVNDQYGHLMGDQLLIHLTNVVNHSIRKEDIFSRYGGEEFLIVMRKTELCAGYKAACHIAQRVRDEVFMLGEQVVNVTISAGVVQYSDMYKDFEEMISDVDLCMYRAKEEGRDRVVHSEGIECEEES